MLFVFQILFILGFVALSPWYLTKMFRRGNFIRGFGQRFGIYSAAIRARAADGGFVWVHACSVGETRVALQLIERLRRRWPEARVALTTTTLAGQTLAARLAPAEVLVLYFPLDFCLCARGALRLLRPRLLVMIETEVWPTLVLMARQRGIPVALVNGRLSTKSFRGYRAVGPLSRHVFGAFDLVCAQGPLDEARYLRLGVRRQALRVTGSMKFDEAQRPASNAEEARRFLEACGADASRPVWVCGSTFAGEEAIVFRVFHQLRKQFPSLFLVVAPRHPERTKEVVAVAQQGGVRLALRTEPPRTGVDAVLVNTTGELKAFYEAATVIFVGKSLCGRGGQNIIEAAAAGAPVLVGPQMQNFEAVAEAFVRAGGAVQVRDERALRAALEDLLAQPDRRREMAARAQQVIARNGGATERTIEAIGTLLRLS